MKQRLIDKITAVLRSVDLVPHLARQKFIAQFVVALINSRKVQFHNIAQYLNNAVKTTSNETRIENFFRKATLDYRVLAVLLLSFLPKKKKCRLCIDRTEWNFGRCEVNILLISIGCGDIQLPFYWELLDNRSGHSNSTDRIALLEKCISVVGKDRIEVILGDREFVGHNGFKYMNDNGLKFVMRVPKHHLLTFENGEQQPISSLCYAPGQPLVLENCQVDGVWGNAWVKSLGDDTYVFLFGTYSADAMGEIYRKRWTIEACFQNLKSRGFDLKSTHLTSLEKLKKLVALCRLAYGICLSMGLHLHRKVQSIKKKSHGYKACRFSRHGLNFIQEYCRPTAHGNVLEIIYLDIIERWIYGQIAHYQ